MLSLRDMLSLGAWRLGLGWLGEILPTAAVAAAVVLALQIQIPKSYIIYYIYSLYNSYIIPIKHISDETFEKYTFSQKGTFIT